MNVMDSPETTLDSWAKAEGALVTPKEDPRGGTWRRAIARTALTPSALAGFDWALNPYQGCGHNCAYCYGPAVLRSERCTWGSRVGVRQNLPGILARELRRKRRGMVGISTVTDPYQPAERRFSVTRLCLEQLAAHDWPVCILTKSDLVVRDLDLLERLSSCEVGLTITTLDEHQRRLMEPGAPPVPRRLAALRLLSGAGIPTYAFLGPIYPTASLNEVRELVRQVHAAGARHIIVDRLNLRTGVWLSVTRALAGDPALLAIARRRVFPPEGEVDFYVRVMAIVEDEAMALGLPIERA